ncbi:MAG TPA: GGDEF domain-containing protein [Agrobacterium sp.]|nr:GGDEF domain-containing protein [Agrobacterium sp.]
MLSTVVTSLSIVVVSLLFGVALLFAWRHFGLKQHAMIWALSFMSSAIGHGLRILGGLFPDHQSLTAMLACHASIGSFALLAWGFRLRAKRNSNSVAIVWIISTLFILVVWAFQLVEWRMASRMMTAIADAALVGIIVHTLRRATGVGRTVRWAMTVFGIYITSVAVAAWLARSGGEISDAAFIIVLSIGTPTGMIASGILTLLIVSADLAGELQRQARYDFLTGLFNRRGFEEGVMARTARPRGERGIVVVTDLDRFKAINDRFGHATGDEVIRRFADHIRGFVGADDMAGRMGGEEFALFMVRPNIAEATALVEKIRQGVPALFLDFPADVPVTASFGLTSIRPGEDFSSAYARADAALYRSKNSGRNKTVADIANVS